LLVETFLYSLLATNNLNIIEIIDIFEFKNYLYICNSKSKKIYVKEKK